MFFREKIVLTFKGLLFSCVTKQSEPCLKCWKSFTSKWPYLSYAFCTKMKNKNWRCNFIPIVHHNVWQSIIHLSVLYTLLKIMELPSELKWSFLNMDLRFSEEAKMSLNWYADKKDSYSIQVEYGKKLLEPTKGIWHNLIIMCRFAKFDHPVLERKFYTSAWRHWKLPSFNILGFAEQSYHKVSLKIQNPIHCLDMPQTCIIWTIQVLVMWGVWS